MSSFWTPKCLGILLLSSALHAGVPEGSLGTTIQTRENLREFFVLTDPGSDEPVGIMALRRTAVMGGMLLERDLCYPDGVRVSESERWRGAGRRFIWREWGHPSRTGRTWIMEGQRGATDLNLLSWVGGPVQRLNLSASEGTLFPLEALDRMRRLGPGSMRLDVVCPLQACVESVTLSCVGGVARPRGRPESQRTLRMRNGRGEEVSHWTFVGDSMIEQGWPSGRRAKIVDEGRYHALFADWSGQARASQP